MHFLFILLRVQRMVREQSVKGKQIRWLLTGQGQLGGTMLNYIQKIVLTARFILGFFQYLDEPTIDLSFEDVVLALGAEHCKSDVFTPM